jgi:dTDP-4-amino-4,6-dideoxygalactose transaminase
VIPFVDLKAQYRALKPEIDGAVAAVLESGEFILGAEVAKFESEFAAHAGTSFAVAVNSGTSALHLALLAAGVGPGHEVITVPFTFVATVAAIGYTGARAILVDVDPDTLTMDVSGIERTITSRTRAIVPVHLYGQCADMTPIRDLARAHGLIVIEDAAQAHGAEYDGRRAGSLADLACFSFYPTKNLGACGEGGVVTTSNAEYATMIRRLRDWGQERKGVHLHRAFNYRMDGLQGAVLRVKLRHLDSWNAARRERAALYDATLRECDVRTPGTAAKNHHVFHVYAIRSPHRDAIQSALTANGVQTGIHYPTPAHLQPAYADLGYRAGDFPVAEQAAREVLSLPIYPELRPEDVECVASVIRTNRLG